MDKMIMYLILGTSMSVGGLIPVLLGQSAFGGWSLLGTTIGGFIGIYIYVKIRQNAN